jgi:hypothetical protein
LLLFGGGFPRAANGPRLHGVNAFVKTILLSVAASGALAGAPHAADLPVPPAPKAKQERAVPAQPNEFDKLGADCVEAFDGCRRFTRAGDGKYDAANNIGIACQPKPLTCTKRK